MTCLYLEDRWFFAATAVRSQLPPRRPLSVWDIHLPQPAMTQAGSAAAAAASLVCLY
jgi:hypothetical protein